MEDDYLRSICGKIKSFKPDLVLVETTITQKAQVRKTSLMSSFRTPLIQMRLFCQEVLRELGIAFVFNVRASIMARLKRIFETEVVSSVLSLVQPPILGSAESFEIRCVLIMSHHLAFYVIFTVRQDNIIFHSSGSTGCPRILCTRPSSSCAAPTLPTDAPSSSVVAAVAPTRASSAA